MIWWTEALGLLARSRSRSLLLVLVWTLTLTLCGALGWAWRNSPRLREAWTSRVPAECYLEQADAPTLDGVRRTLAGSRTLEWAGLLDPAQAAAEFRSGFDLDVVELLGENPFPTTVLLRVRPAAELAQLDRDLAALDALPGVSGVHVERELLGELGAGLRRAGRAALVLLLLISALTAALLAAALRSLRRAWRGEAVLLAFQGVRAGPLARPLLIALALPALAALLISWLLLAGLQRLPARLGLSGAVEAPLWPLLLGVALPLVVASGFVLRRMGRLIMRGE
ncbi:MAG: hypothetical protein WC326_14270 [Candidatus Delongbacteria bacterium]